jgi:NAD(P)-dependent dehydrogenase (short-subunit alcohol dehydrogenase family)
MMVRMGEGPFGGEVAVVTGGGSGIGRALGERLVDEGATVVLADVDGERAHEAAGRLGERAVGREVDVRDLDAVHALVADVADRYGGVDLFFANAGIGMGGPADELTSAHWDRVIDVNLRGAVNSVLAVYPHMVERGRGHIVLTASAAGLAPPPLVAAYATTKHAVVGLGLGLRPEAALRGVRVSVLCPGAVDTPILDEPPPPDLPQPSVSLTARQYLAAIRQKPMPVDRFARKALRQVARNRPVIAIPASTAALWRLHCLAPSSFDRITRSLARRVLDAA